MYWLSNLAAKPGIAAGLCLVVGFVGSVVGIVYGWSYDLDRVWFLVWMAASLYFCATGARKWWRAKLGELNPKPVVMPSLPQSRRLRETHATPSPGVKEVSDARRSEQGHPDVSI